MLSATSSDSGIRISGMLLMGLSVVPGFSASPPCPVMENLTFCDDLCPFLPPRRLWLLLGFELVLLLLHGDPGVGWDGSWAIPRRCARILRERYGRVAGSRPVGDVHYQEFGERDCLRYSVCKRKEGCQDDRYGARLKVEGLARHSRVTTQQAKSKESLRKSVREDRGTEGKSPWELVMNELMELIRASSHKTSLARGGEDGGLEDAHVYVACAWTTKVEPKIPGSR